MSRSKKVLILTYYWPPSGGSGVQRWMYFAKYLKQLGWEPIVITVDEQQAAYARFDHSLTQEVEGIRVIKTRTREPLKLYAKLMSGSSQGGIPQGEVNTQGFLGKCAAYIRGNFFIPDARKGWVPFARKAAQDCLEKEDIAHVITTGPPHSTHLVGLYLRKHYSINWWVDFRDPWSEVFYNKQMRRTKRSQLKDLALEKQVLTAADGVFTTIGGAFHQSLKAKAPQQRFIALANGYDAELMEQVSAAPPQDVFHIVYTGLLTQQQAYPSLVKALQGVSIERPIRLSLAGNITPSIIQSIQKALPKVEVNYQGYLTHSNAVALMKSAHLLVNFIFEGATSQMISGKLLEYFATQVPVLSLGDPESDAAAFMAKGTNAKMFAKGNIPGIQGYIKALYEQDPPLKNKMNEMNQWSRKAITERLIEHLLS
ncbi:MAG: glycosyltransferase [Flavobacteriaceae bacterium]